MESLNLSKEGISVIASDNTITHEVSEEFILPDYIPEIRKLLTCKAQVLPESRYVSEKDVQGSGSITYHLIYTDDEGNLCGTPLSSSYEVQVPISPDSKTVLLDTVIESTQPRVNGPRRISVRSRLKSRALCLKNKEISENITPKSSADEMFLQRQRAEIDTFDIYEASLDGIKISDQFDMKDLKEARPLWCDAIATIKDYKVRDRGISVRGDAYVKCICQGENSIFTLSKQVPIAEEIECESARERDCARVEIRCVSLSISNEQSLDAPQLFFDLCCEIRAEVLRKRRVEATTDCYSTKCESAVAYTDLESYEGVKMQQASFTLTERVKRKNNDADIIIDQIVNPICEKIEARGEALHLAGKLYTSIIARGKQDENGQGEYLCDSYEIPFKYDLDLPKPVNNSVVRVVTSASRPSARYDDGGMHISCEIYFGIMLLEKNKTRVIDNATLLKDQEVKNDASVVKVYFPKNGDTLWEIAKKYHTTTAKLESENDLLEGDTLSKPIIV